MTPLTVPRRVRHTTRPAPARARPWLETLESRALPSTLTVVNAADSGPGSLRAALATAADGDTIDFDAGLAGQTILLTSGPLVINRSLDVEGLGADRLTVNGSNNSRVFSISTTAAAVKITGLTVAGGSATQGGGIYAAGGRVVLGGLVLSGNQASGIGQGGGVYLARGDLSLIASTVSGNTAVGRNGSLSGPGGMGAGGGVYQAGGSLQIVSSTLSANQATGGGGYSPYPLRSGPGGPGGLGAGGGVYQAGGSLQIVSSTLSANRAAGGNGGRGGSAHTGSRGGTGGVGGSGEGGGLYLVGGSAQITDSTLSANQATGGNGGAGGDAVGGGVSGDGGDGGDGAGVGVYLGGGALALTSSTVANNQAAAGLGGPAGGPVGHPGAPGSAFAGGIANYSGTPTLRDTIVARNTAPGGPPDISGTSDSQGHNLIGNGTGGSGYAPTDLVGTAAHPINPLLGPLRDNGGPTQTMAPLPGSPAVDAGDDADAPDFDQRGDGYARVVGGAIDIGAVEAQVGDAVAFALAAPAAAVAGTPFDVTVTALDAYGHVAAGYAGAVIFAASDGDPGVALPADYAFQASDAGAVTFPGGVTLITPGDQALTVEDVRDGSLLGVATVAVGAGGAPGPGGAVRAAAVALPGAALRAGRLAPTSPGSDQGGRPLERLRLDALFGLPSDVGIAGEVSEPARIPPQRGVVHRAGEWRLGPLPDSRDDEALARALSRLFAL